MRLLPKIEYLCAQSTREVVYAYIAFDQTVMLSRSETDNEVDVHARRAIARCWSDAKIFRQFRHIPLESESIDYTIIMNLNNQYSLSRIKLMKIIQYIK